SYCNRAVRDLHSFPTRRSSDLPRPVLLRHPCMRPSCALPTLLPGPPLLSGHPEEPTPREEARAGTGAPPPTSSPTRTPCLPPSRSEEHTSELQSRENLVCRLLL